MVKDLGETSSSTAAGLPIARKWQQRRQHRVNAVDQDDDQGPPAENEEDEDPSEAGQLEQEAEILMTHAAKKRAENEKGRGLHLEEKDVKLQRNVLVASRT